jgi:hypothetical protein
MNTYRNHITNTQHPWTHSLIILQTNHIPEHVYTLALYTFGSPVLFSIVGEKSAGYEWGSIESQNDFFTPECLFYHHYLSVYRVQFELELVGTFIIVISITACNPHTSTSVDTRPPPPLLITDRTHILDRSTHCGIKLYLMTWDCFLKHSRKW